MLPFVYIYRRYFFATEAQECKSNTQFYIVKVQHLVIHECFQLEYMVIWCDERRNYYLMKIHSILYINIWKVIYYDIYKQTAI